MTEKTISLDIFDRITIKKMFQEKEQQVGGISGFSLDELRIAIKILDKIDISEEEAKEANLVVSGNVMSWSSNELKDFDLKKSELELVNNILSRRTFWELDERNLKLGVKFGINFENDESSEENVDLDLFERLVLSNSLFSMNGKIESLNNLNKILKIIKKIEISNEDRQLFNRKESIKETEYELVQFLFSKDEMSVIKNCLEKNSNFPLDKRVFSFLEKFGIKSKEEE